MATTNTNIEKSNKTKRYVILALAAVLFILTIATMVIIDVLVEATVGTYEELMTMFEGSEMFERLLDPDFVKNAMIADLFILLAANFVIGFFAIRDEIPKRKTLLIICSIIGLLSCPSTIATLLSIAELVVICLIKRPVISAKQKSSAPAIKRLGD